ncbi:TetR/AcrR family transcriptional regulator [Cyclobacterium sp.]|uniref:TetR/AcrR family transcriptional regulator n=1 Tax=Cyclobacterium sp. TaxID=1966343 RepID=UPI00199A3738|nr:TetR/AcrR family transcriptional regulator [Cyclobacterium sp.]MBD3626865.1 TetR/AcrR family transcriptional regulator [Cyclobacterium sp.]
MARAKSFDTSEVLDRAMELFWRKGYHATSVQDLVSHLGINRASLYDTFKGKEDLFLKAFENYRENNKAAILEALYSQPNAKDGIRNLFECALKERKERKGCFTVNLTAALMPEDKHLQEILRDNQKVFEKIIFDYLKSGEVMGEFPKGKDLRAIANLLYTLYNGVQVISKIEAAPSRQMAAVEQVLQFLEVE